jgi:predicted transcriptional regulator
LAQLAGECQRLLQRAGRIAAQAEKRLGRDESAARSATLAVFALQTPALADQIPDKQRAPARPLLTTRRRGGDVRDQVLAHLEDGPLTIYELTQQTGLAAHQVRGAIRGLADKGQVTATAERRAIPGRKGPHSTVYTLNR